MPGEDPLRARRAGAAALLGLIVTVALGLPFAGDSVARGPDLAIDEAVRGGFAGQHELLDLAVLPTEPVVLLPVIGLLLVLCAWYRDARGAALAVLGPSIAVAANTWIVKPAFGRVLDDHLAYPSGHTVSLVAVGTVLALLARPGMATRLVVLLGVCLLPVVAIGMIGLGYHYATDVLGAAVFGASAVLGVAVLLDSLRGGRSR